MILTRAPLRLTLGGGGTDLPSYYKRSGGFVLSMALDKYVYICLNRPSADDLIRVKYSRYEEVGTVDEVEHDLVRPALTHLGVLGNVEISSMADVPAGTGLGSSSTYLVALLAALHELKRERLAPQALAEEAFWIEAELAGHPVGKQDHYLAALGGITSLEIAQDGEVSASPLPLPVSIEEQILGSMLLFFTGMRRAATTILAEQASASTRGDSGVIGSLDRTREIGYEVREALVAGDVASFGSLLHEHWETKKLRSSRISDARVDALYERARDAGALGGKIVGAGGGGFLALCCQNGTRPRVRAAMAEAGLREMPIALDREGAKVMVNL